MNMPDITSRRIVYARWLLASAGVFAAFAAAGTGIAVHYWAPASDLATANDMYWSEAKYFVLDVQMGMVFLAAAGLLGWGLLRVLTRRIEAGAVPRIGRLIAAALGILIVCIFARVIVKNHPIFVEALRLTAYPSSERPDQITLTWGGLPETTQSIQWRTSPVSPAKVLRYRPQGTEAWVERTSEAVTFYAENLTTDQTMLWHTVALTELAPGTAYEYGVGHGSTWTETRTFTTASAAPEPFTFMYLGDSQNGLLDYGRLLEVGKQTHPDTAFVIHAGDLVNRGCDRDDWDLFFHASRNVFDRSPLMPAIGNHDDCNDLDPRLYLMYFDLPKNGSPALPLEQTYHFTYGNALFVTLNSNRRVEEQTPWLDEVLGKSDAQWKFLLWHHPAYASRAVRDNVEVRESWGAIADKYGVDIVFQGHDHAYARSKPMHGGKPAEDKIPGTIYLLAVSGTKYYDQDPNENFEVGYENLSTYQILRIDGGTLRYEAYDIDNKLVDEFTLQK
jgi:hypothetical protein